MGEFPVKVAAEILVDDLVVSTKAVRSFSNEANEHGNSTCLYTISVFLIYTCLASVSLYHSKCNDYIIRARVL